MKSYFYIGHTESGHTCFLFLLSLTTIWHAEDFLSDTHWLCHCIATILRGVDAINFRQNQACFKTSEPQRKLQCWTIHTTHYTNTTHSQTECQNWGKLVKLGNWYKYPVTCTRLKVLKVPEFSLKLKSLKVWIRGFFCWIVNYLLCLPWDRLLWEFSVWFQELITFTSSVIQVWAQAAKSTLKQYAYNVIRTNGERMLLFNTLSLFLALSSQRTTEKNQLIRIITQLKFWWWVTLISHFSLSHLDLLNFID